LINRDHSQTRAGYLYDPEVLFWDVTVNGAIDSSRLESLFQIHLILKQRAAVAATSVTQWFLQRRFMGVFGTVHINAASAPGSL